MKLRALCIAGLLATGLSLAHGQVLGGSAWTSLSAQQRQVLAPVQAQWSQLDGDTRDRLALLAARYPGWAPEEQQRLRERLAEWTQLSAAERQRIHLGFQAAQRVNPSDREQKWQRYQALSPEQRQALQERGARRLKEPAVAASAPAERRPALAGVAAVQANTLLPLRGPRKP